MANRHIILISTASLSNLSTSELTLWDFLKQDMSKSVRILIIYYDTYILPVQTLGAIANSYNTTR